MQADVTQPISETTATTQPISETTATTQPISETTATTQPISEATNEGNPPFRDETAEEWATRGNRLNVPRMDLRGIGDHLPREPLFAVSSAVNEHTPFQIAFTSGTTSEPRGIVHTHRNRSEERRVGKECRSRWSPHHDNSNN